MSEQVKNETEKTETIETKEATGEVVTPIVEMPSPTTSEVPKVELKAEDVSALASLGEQRREQKSPLHPNSDHP